MKKSMRIALRRLLAIMLGLAMIAGMASTTGFAEISEPQFLSEEIIVFESLDETVDTLDPKYPAPSGSPITPQGSSLDDFDMLQSGVTVSGRVDFVDIRSGNDHYLVSTRPVPNPIEIVGVSVVLHNITTGESLAVLTDTDGKFEFTNVSNGEYLLVKAHGDESAVLSPGDFGNAEVTPVPTAKAPPIEFAPDDRHEHYGLGANLLDFLLPSTIKVTVAGESVLNQNFLLGPVIHTEFKIDLNGLGEDMIVLPNNLITAAYGGTFGSFPPGKPINTSLEPGYFNCFISDLDHKHTQVHNTDLGDENHAPHDGEFTIQNTKTTTRSNVIGAWWQISDRTTGNETGKMMIVNVKPNDLNPDEDKRMFFETTVNVKPDTYYFLSAWVLNLFTISGNASNPEIVVTILCKERLKLHDPFEIVIDRNYSVPEWVQVGMVFNSGENGSLTIQFTNELIFGSDEWGNDIAFDDIMLQRIRSSNVTVTFVASPEGGGTVNDEPEDSITVQYNHVISSDDLPTVEANTGYRFSHWGDEDGNPLDPVNHVVTDEVTFYAIFVQEWTVTFDLDNGTYAGNQGLLEQTVEHGANATALSTEPTKIGFEFIRWVADPVGATLTNVTENRTFTAQWEPINPHTVTFHLEGGSYAGTTPLIQEVAHGDTATRPAPDPTRTGFTFAGWFTAATGGVLFDFDTPITEQTDIYARWTPVEQTTEPQPEPLPLPQQQQQQQTEPEPEEPEVLPVRFREAFLIGIPNEDGVRLISPYSDITRAEIATVFFRKVTDEMREEFWVQENPFNDVELEQWFNNAISTTVNIGLFDGIGDDAFAPTQPATRGELAAVLVRFMYIDAEPFSAVSEGRDQFNDIYEHWARAYINEAAANGWVQGLEGIYGPFNPDEPISRAEAAAMFNRAFERLVETVDCLLPDMLAFPDKTRDAWYYTYLKIASNSYTYERREDNPLYKNLLEVIEPRDWTVLERPDSRPQDIYTQVMLI